MDYVFILIVAISTILFILILLFTDLIMEYYAKKKHSEHCDNILEGYSKNDYDLIYCNKCGKYL